MRRALILLLAPLAACGNVAPVTGGSPTVTAPDACLPANLARFTGQPATAALVKQMLAATGKTMARKVEPGMMVTMDFREDRLTIHVDAANKVERASCG